MSQALCYTLTKLIIFMYQKAFSICRNDRSEVKVIMAVLSRVQLFVTPWTVAQQAPLSMGFPRQEYWNGLTFPSPGDLLNPEIEPASFAFQVDSLPLSHHL